MADPALHQTQPIKQIAIDYTPEACTHCPVSNSITLTYDHRGGARWRSTTRFLYGTFSALIQCPKGNTTGLNFNLYLSSLEGDKEQIHDLGFDCSDGFHEFVIKWGLDLIEWLIDGKVVRRAERKESEAFPEKPMFLYASVWDASCIDGGRWAGNYVGCDAPYVCLYKDIHVPSATAVECSSDS
ncbi:hypothetical protein SLE2022_179420 [Rubroshorea leprosula]